jgi:hypothetical protein
MVGNGKAEFSKTLSFVLSRSMLESHHDNLKKSLEELLLTIAQETELIQQDHLARGQVVHSTSVSASLVKKTESEYWKWRYDALQTPAMESDPPEYWGTLSYLGWVDFISDTDRYPWMSESVSEVDIPF